MRLDGWKTYLAAALGIAVEGALALGYLTVEQARMVETILGFLGLAALRKGVANGGGK